MLRIIVLFGLFCFFAYIPKYLFIYIFSGVVTTSVPRTVTLRRMSAPTTTRVPDGDFWRRPTLLSVLPSCLRSRPDDPHPSPLIRDDLQKYRLI